MRLKNGSLTQLPNIRLPRAFRGPLMSRLLKKCRDRISLSLKYRTFLAR